MDAHALLVSQGWRGTGHSLHPDSDSNGLTHHILIKRNEDGRGLGLKKADHKAEAWWLNAFDQALKGINTNTGTMKQTLRNGDLSKITTKGLAKYTGSRGLYNSFVKGGVIEGSVGKLIGAGGLLTPPDSGAATPTNQDDDMDKVKSKKKSKTKSKDSDKETSEKDDKRAHKEAKAAKKAEKKKAKEALKATETKEERRARRDARRKRKEKKRRAAAGSG